MEHLAHRCAAVAAAALAVGGLVTALTPMTQSPPDLQIRDFDLASANVDVTPAIDVAENHVRADLSGTGDPELQQINLGEMLLGGGSGDVGDGSTFNVGDLDQNELSALLGGGLDPQSLVSPLPADVDLGGVVPPPIGGFAGGADQAAGTAAAGVSTAIVAALQGLPALQQAVAAAVGAAEVDYNTALVAAQEAATAQLFGDNPEVNEVVNWIFTVNNSVLAQNQGVLNGLLGVTMDTQSSLLGNADPGLADADWSTLVGLTPDDLSQIVNAIQADNLSLLGSVDWTTLFSSFF